MPYAQRPYKTERPKPLNFDEIEKNAAIVKSRLEYVSSVLKQKNDPLQSRSKENRDKYNRDNPHKEKLA